jgi:hypothetical protein
MGGIHDLLARYGYVRLADYGLVLTPDRRILATRPAILDDGGGGRIVGWLDRDLATAELEALDVQQKPVPKPPPAPLPRREPAALSRLTPTTPIQTLPVTIEVESVVRVEPVVAPPTPEEEDDWQWEIAMARARAVADEVELARPPLSPSARGSSAFVVRDATKLGIEPAKPESLPLSKPPTNRTPGTVIPVPSLPVATAAQPVRPLDVCAPRRFPRATDHRVTAMADDRTATRIRVPRRA